MKPVPARQRQQAHRQRKAFARALHQLRRIWPQWRRAWGRFDARRGPRPARIKLPRMVRKHKAALYRALTAG